MEYQKITNLLGTTTDKVPRFITKKWVEGHDQSGEAENRYKLSKPIRVKSSILKSDLTLTKTNGRDFIDVRNRFLEFKTNVPIY